MGLEVPRVTSGLMIVAVHKDGVAEGILWENVNMPFVCENMVIILPV